MKIALWGFYGFGNLGDEAIQQAVIANIRARIPEARISAICLDPRHVSRLFDIPAYPIYRGEIHLPSGSRAGEARRASPAAVATRARSSALRQALDFAKRVPLLGSLISSAWSVREHVRYFAKMRHFVGGLDLLIVSGSGVLDDTWRGRWLRPFALYRWCLAARLTRTPLLFVSIGATSLGTRLGRFFARQALAMACYRSFRDGQSLDLARGLGLKADDVVMPDLAFSLDIERYTAIRGAGQRTVGIGPIPYCDPRVWPERNAAIYRDYIAKLASLIERLAAQGYSIRFIVGEKRVDALAVQDVIEALPPEIRRATAGSAEPAISSVDDLLAAIAETDYIVTSRFHGVLLPYLLGKPVLALSYNSKFANLMAALGQEQYCLDIRSFEVDRCMGAFQAMVADREAIAAKLVACGAAHRRALSAQYDRILGCSTDPLHS